MSEANEHTGIGRRAWLYMLREGGYWTSSELAGVFNYDEKDMRVCLSGMAKADSLKRKPLADAKNRTSFGVTRDCSLPRGLRLQELIDAGAIKEDE